MRILLSGQKYFGQEVLALLLKGGLNVVAVSAPEESINGKPDRLWSMAMRSGVPLIRSGLLNASTLPAGIDLIVCAHSHDYMGAETLRRTRLGGIGYHPSLLPRHRGRDAVQWAIRMGDPITGGSVYWLNERVDGGPIAAQDWCFIPKGIKPPDLWVEYLQPMGLRLFHRAISDIMRGRIVAVPQDERFATWEPSIGRPPLFKPDLIRIGPPPKGFEVITSRGGVHVP